MYFPTSELRLIRSDKSRMKVNDERNEWVNDTGVDSKTHSKTKTR